MENIVSRLVFFLLFTLGISCASFATEVTILAPNAAKEAVLEAQPVFEMTTGHKAVISWTGTEAITKRIAAGEVVDIVVNAGQNIERQSRDGRLITWTRTDFARSGIGTAIPATSAKVNVSNQEGLKEALLSAKSVVVSSGTSGRHIVGVFEKLGIDILLNAKIKQPPSGAQIAEILASGNADIGFQQISELMHAKGIHYLGPLPSHLQSYTVYSAAIHSDAPNPDVAKEFQKALRSPSVKAVISASGMDPV